MDLGTALRHIETVAKEKQSPEIPLWAWGVCVCLATLIVFLPALRFPFFPFWDDDIHVHANPHLANLSWNSIWAFWSGPWQQLYIPLTYSTWAGLAALSRWWDGQPIAAGALNAAWFHSANIVAHAVSTALVYVLLHRTLTKFSPKTTGNRLGIAAALGAGFFALHPLQVEPVAWISGLRDVLGGCLGLASLVVLLGGERTTIARWSLATLLFLASLAAKPAGVALPLVAGLLAGFPLAWKPVRIARELGPWLLIGALWVFITSNAQWAAELAKNLVPVWTRPFVAADALAFYMAKVVWPAGLSADYGRAPDIVYARGWLWWLWIGPVALAGVLAAAKPLRIYLVPLGIFAAALLPTLGLVPFNFQVVSTVADRYAYFAMLGPALALGMVVARSKQAWVPAAGAAVVIALGALTAIRLPLWSEDLKLFAATLETNPDSWKAMHNYASALDDRGRTVEGETLMRKVIARRPDSAEAYNDIGVMLWKLGRREEAAQATQRALELRSTPGAAKNLATMQAELGNQAGQIDALRRALEMDPDDLLRAQQLAWALSTSQDAQLRNGEEALGLAQKVINSGVVTPQAVIVLVAAQAETGQYESAKSNALALAQQLEAAGDPFAETVKRDVLAPVQSGRPIRGAMRQ
jgi:tetratricopeptide (TPR) repeat protein